MKKSISVIATIVVSSIFIAGCSSDSSTTADAVNPQTDISETDGLEGGLNDTDAIASDETEAGSVNTDTLVDLNGDYTVDVILNAASQAVPECQSAEGGLTVNGTSITGTVDGDLFVTGMINPDLTITGGFAFDGGSIFASYTGMVVGNMLAGEWQDIFGCAGTWEALMLE